MESGGQAARVSPSAAVGADAEALRGHAALADLTDLLRTNEHRLAGIVGLDDAFHAYARSGEPEQMFLGHLRDLASNPFADRETFYKDSLIIFSNANFVLSIKYTRPSLPAKPLLSTSVSTRIVSLVTRDRQLRIRVFELPSSEDLAVFNPDAELRLVGSTNIDKGANPFWINAGQVADYIHADALATLVLEEMEKIPFQWGFDSATLKPLFASTTRSGISRVETLLEVLLALKRGKSDQELISVLRSLCGHPLHFVRWKAVQTLAVLDSTEGLSALRKMRRDPHPHIAAAARKTLSAHKQRIAGDER